MSYKVTERKPKRKLHDIWFHVCQKAPCTDETKTKLFVHHTKHILVNCCTAHHLQHEAFWWQHHVSVQQDLEGCVEAILIIILENRMIQRIFVTAASQTVIVIPLEYNIIHHHNNVLVITHPAHMDAY